MILYHGTNRANANSMCGPLVSIDVTRGGGELGRGFYMGGSLALTKSWAVARHGLAQASGLKAVIDDVLYFQLHILTLNHSAVINTWQQLRYNNTERTHLFNIDVVYGPLATYPHETQHKFESSRARVLLNNSQWSVI